MPDSEDSVSEFAGWPQAGEVFEMLAVPDSEGMVFEFAVWPQCGLPEVVDAFPEPDSKSLDRMDSSKLIRRVSSMFGRRYAVCSWEVVAPRRTHPSAAPELYQSVRCCGLVPAIAEGRMARHVHR